MNDNKNQPHHSSPATRHVLSDSLNLQGVQRLRILDVTLTLAGIVAIIIQHGLKQITPVVYWELGAFSALVMLFLTVSLAVRYRWSLTQRSFIVKNKLPFIASGIWLLGMVLILLFGRLLPALTENTMVRPAWFVVCSEACLLLRGLLGGISFVRKVTEDGRNPALQFVASFLFLIVVGTGLLLLPRARAQTAPENESWQKRARVALFTSTSASCVTGLIVVDTGGETPYWSRTGQVIILSLFQLGGLGIMTCSAFFAVAARRQFQLGESATLRDILDSDRLGDVRKLLFVILTLTLAAEAIGAFVISDLFSHLPLGEQIFQSLFHSVSAFCNAGFALTNDSFTHAGMRWQVWGGISTLIIIGGLGFGVLYNIYLSTLSRIQRFSKRNHFTSKGKKVHFSISTKLVLVTSISLLVAGTVGFYLLESTGPISPEAPPVTTAEKIAHAWFQAVTFRTAGFNTIDLGKCQPATKLLAIMQMFIGASPGSTGGGVKTTCAALVLLSLGSILRGRERVEFMGRSITHQQVNRAYAVFALGLIAVMSTTMLLAVFERTNERAFIDLMFEATSAFATVGVSTGITSDLTSPSQLVIIVTMFLGRVGPLTLLMAMLGRAKSARFEYPTERVPLG
ncbi:KtrAB potassium uptake system, integral membrane component KtrB [hydrothermal vent metagenome]|uniref:KtrAB potassium uptake system, integral membrane component KtrB n=1 Tax=hydrothermal vent metagenome TaxID=652676 RepID=A0A3B1E0T6_9ZZZZ